MTILKCESGKLLKSDKRNFVQENENTQLKLDVTYKSDGFVF